MMKFIFEGVTIFEDNAGFLHGFFYKGDKNMAYLNITENGFSLSEVGGILLMEDVDDMEEITGIVTNQDLIKEFYNDLSNPFFNYQVGTIQRPIIMWKKQNMGLEGKRWFGVED